MRRRLSTSRARTTTRRRASRLLAGVTAIAASVTGWLLISGAPASGSANATSCDPAQHLPSSLKWPGATWKVCVDGAIAQSSPTVATYNGETLLAVGDENGVVHLLNAATGAEMPGWPERLAGAASARIAIEGSPAIGYLNGPSRPPSIVVASGSTWVSNSVGEVEAFSLAGAPEWTFHVGRAAGTALGVISSPAIGDVTGGGEQVVFGSWDHKIYVLNAAGDQVGFAYDNADTIWSSPALYRMPGQRTDDVFLGSDASGRTYTTPGGSIGRCVGGFIDDYRWSARAVDPDTGATGPGLVRRWFQCVPQSIWSSPAIGDLTGSGPDVVVGTGYFEQPFPAATNRIYAFDAATGASLPGWPARTPGPTYGSPAIGAIDSSGQPAVVDVSWDCSGETQQTCTPTNTSYVAAYSATGKRMWTQHLLGPTAFGSPILVPLQGESWNDVLVGTPNAVYPLDGPTGSTLFGTNTSNQFAAIDNGCRVFNTPAVADVAGTGSGSGWHLFDACGGPVQFGQPGEIASYPLPSPPSVTPAWPMWRATPDHSGVTQAG